MEEKKKKRLRKQENKEWLHPIKHILEHEGPERVKEILEIQIQRIREGEAEPGI